MQHSYAQTFLTPYMRQYSPERLEYIRLSVEFDLFKLNEQFILCKNKENALFFLQKNDAVHPEVHILNEEEKNAALRQFSLKQLSEDAFSPKEQKLKAELSEFLYGYFPKQSEKKVSQEKEFSKLFFVVIIIIALGFVGIKMFHGHGTASIEIKASEPFKRVFLNQEAVQIRNLKVEDVLPGSYTITLLFHSGDTLSQFLEIREAKVYPLFFQLKQKIEHIPTGIRIESNIDGFQLEVDSISYGNLTEVELLEGLHTVRILKEGYLTEPSFRAIYLNKNERLKLPFTLQKRTEKVVGFDRSLRVNANVSGADIYLNGKHTGKQTNYTFTNLSEQTFSVRIFKKGYSSKESTRTVTFSAREAAKTVPFQLIKNVGNVSIETQNTSASIFIDGKLAGNGRVDTLLKTGRYTFSFQEIPRFFTPSPQVVEISAKRSQSFEAVYLPKVEFIAHFSLNKFTSTELTSERGFVINGSFKNDGVHFPPIKQNQLILTYPFEYNNPRAGHAIKLTFQLPNHVIVARDLFFYIDLETGSSTYNFLGDPNGELSIVINNKRVFLNQKITSSVLKFKINPMIRTGTNEILIYTTENNNLPIKLTKFRLSHE